MIGNSNDDQTNFPQKLLLFDAQVSRPCNGSCSPVNTKLSKSLLSRIMQLGGFMKPFLKSMYAIEKLGAEVLGR